VSGQVASGTAAGPITTSEPLATREGLGRPRVSACILSLDEADRIEECLRSVDWCDEILVVDSHSKDATREIAASLGARVIERDWPGFGPQREFAIRNASNDWIFLIDCDERVSPELRASILGVRDAGFPARAGWKCARLAHYLGRWIRHGVWYPNRQLRLFDRRRARVAGHEPHDRVELDSPPGLLRGDLLHFPYRSLDEHLRTIERYTAIMARDLHRRGRRASVLDLALRPPARFAKSYFLRLGLLDGWRGLLVAALAAHYVRMKYAKLFVLQDVRDPP